MLWIRNQKLLALTFDVVIENGLAERGSFIVNPEAGSWPMK